MMEIQPNIEFILNHFLDKTKNSTLTLNAVGERILKNYLIFFFALDFCINKFLLNFQLIFLTIRNYLL